MPSKISIPVLFASAALLAPGLALAKEPARVAVPPAEHPADCFARNMRVPPELAPYLPDRSDVFFQVKADGKVAAVHADDVATRAVLPYVRDALQLCPMAAARDANGRPVASEVELEIRFVS